MRRREYRSYFGIRMLSFFLALLFAISAQAQVGTFDYEDELRNKHISEIRKKIEQIIQNNPGTVEAIFFGALIEMNAEKSIEAYNKVIKQFPQTDYAAKSLFKLGQYYYSKGLYVSARNNFLKLLKDFPNSSYSEKSAYFAASCLCASKKIDQCSDELKEFISEHHDSELRNLAQLDYEELRPVRQQLAISQKELIFDKSAKFTLQLGVFTKPNNALNYRKFFTKLNLPVVIRERKMRNKPIYFVLLGSYQDKETAEKMGEKLRQQHGKPYRVVEIK